MGVNWSESGMKTLLQAISTAQTDKTQFTKITDGTDTWLIDGSGRGLVAGDVTPSDTQSNPTDDIGVAAHLMGYNGGAGQWRRLIATQATFDGLSGANNILNTQALSYGYNGSTFDRLRSVNTGQLVVTLKDSTGVEPIDAVTNALVVIDEPHHEIHTGNHFSVQNIQTGVSAGSTFDYQITAPNTTKRIHFEMQAAVTGNSATLVIYEDPTTSGGTSLTAYNRERNSATAATAAMVYTPTVTSTGTTAIASDFLPAGVNMTNESRSEAEWVLKQNTKYLIRYTISSGAAATIVSHFEWYEE